MQEQNPIITDDQSELKKRATRRLIIAVLLVVAAVTVLTILSKKKPVKPITAETPAIIAETPSQPDFAPPLLPEAELPAAEEPPPPEVVTSPIEEATPATPPPPQVSAQPGLKPTPQAMPAPRTATATTAKPLIQAQPSLPPAKPVTQPSVRQVTEQSSITPKPQPAAAQPPVAQPASAQPKAYAVQLGVFSNPANAIQLQEKLAQHGIKSYTETRVHVGPFKDKAEADQAMAKIRALGIGAVVVPQH